MASTILLRLRRLIYNGSFLFVNYTTVHESTPDEKLAFTISPSRTRLNCLTHESYFVFGDAEEYCSADLDTIGAKYQATFPMSVVEPIQHAAIANNATKKKYKRLLKAQLGL